MSVPARLAFVGLGAMGSRLARRLLTAGHHVTGWNRSADKARALTSLGLTVAASPRAAAANFFSRVATRHVRRR